MSSLHNTAPPPYSAAGEHSNVDIASDKSAQHAQHQQPITNPNATTYHLRSHISSLPTRIRDSNVARADRHAAADSALLENVLVPHVEAFLAEVAALPDHPPSATLVLYPAAAMMDVGADASEGKKSEEDTPKLSGLDDMQRCGEFVRVQGVDGFFPSPKEKDVDSKQGGLYSGSPEARLWWRDEAMARRLAAYIQPKPEEDPNVAPPAFFDADVARHEKQQREQEQGSKKKSWSLKKFLGGNNNQSSSPTSTAKTQSTARSGSQGREYAVQSVNASELDTRAGMTVKAEEMTFRVENDMGLYESFNGWALVARVDFMTRR